MNRFQRVAAAANAAMDTVKSFVGGQLVAALEALDRNDIQEGKNLIIWALDYLEYDASGILEKRIEEEEDTNDLEDILTEEGLSEAEIETFLRSGWEILEEAPAKKKRGAGFSSLGQAMRYAKNIPPDYIEGFVKVDGFWHVVVNKGD